jgi:hypothetical protein
MDPSRSNRVLNEWDAVARSAQRPAAPPRGIVMRSGLPGGMLVAAGLAVALVLAVVLIGRGSDGPVGGVIVASASPTALAVATPEATATPTATGAPTAPRTAAPARTAKPTATATAAATPRPTPTPTPTPVATPVATVGRCDPTSLVARITMWEGAAGSRIATVEMTNAGPRCTIATMDRPQLVDGREAVLIDGTDPATSSSLTLNRGQKVTALVNASNYCGKAPVPPVTVQFVLSDGRKIKAAPLSPADATVPPCNGAGSPAHIEMRPWSR